MIDPKKLPHRCLLDTEIWIRALSSRPDPKSVACRNFFDAMIEHGRQMLMAAPTLAELVRGDPAFALPSTYSVLVVPFDRKAAQLLGVQFPVSVLKGLVNGKTTLSYLKYDAMIAACALRWNVGAMIAYDTDHVKLAKLVAGLKIRTPGDFEEDPPPQRLLEWNVPLEAFPGDDDGPDR